ncbi:MAG: amidohydrolase family protein [Qingshengfaniella sp.]
MDLILRNARIAGQPVPVADIGIKAGRIAALEPGLVAPGREIDLGGRLVSPGFVETHIHLDKSCILHRCGGGGDLNAAIQEVSQLKADFTAEDVYARGSRTIEKCIAQGTTHMRTHLELDPTVAMRSFEAVQQLVRDYAWAIDIEICAFPQEGLLNNPGTDELLVEAMKRGAHLIGGAPYVDSNPHGQIDRIFQIAREFDTDIDLHLDFGTDGSTLDLDYVCELTTRYGRGGRVAIGHVTKLAHVPPEQFAGAARRMADAGVALTVLPSTDLYLMGRDRDHAHTRGVAHAHELLHHGVNCSLSTNNVLNPFTPFGDCSLIRMANLNANICHIGSAADTEECFNMVTTRSAQLMNIHDYGIAVGNKADLVVIDAATPRAAVAELAPVLMGFKDGVQVLNREPAQILRPGGGQA